jgi:hypothetical protein
MSCRKFSNDLDRSFIKIGVETDQEINSATLKGEEEEEEEEEEEKKKKKKKKKNHMDFLYTEFSVMKIFYVSEISFRASSTSM